MAVTIRQLNSNGVSPQLWHQLEEAYKRGGNVNLDGHPWIVTGIRTQLRNQGSSALATIKRSDIK